MSTATNKPSENLNIVIVGHVDDGKSTLLGRLYADTGSLPDGKLEKVQAICRQQGKEFEYAFLFDAFLEEQEQGITIDTARTFFIWKGRQYIIIYVSGVNSGIREGTSAGNGDTTTAGTDIQDAPDLWLMYPGCKPCLNQFSQR